MPGWSKTMARLPKNAADGAVRAMGRLGRLWPQLSDVIVLVGKPRPFGKHFEVALACDPRDFPPGKVGFDPLSGRFDRVACGVRGWRSGRVRPERGLRGSPGPPGYRPGRVP